MNVFFPVPVLTSSQVDGFTFLQRYIDFTRICQNSIQFFFLGATHVVNIETCRDIVYLKVCSKLAMICSVMEMYLEGYLIPLASRCILVKQQIQETESAIFRRIRRHYKRPYNA